MNYSKKISRESTAKRVLLSWLIVGAVMLLVGGIIGYALGAYISHRNSTKTDQQGIYQEDEESPAFGAYEGQATVLELPDDWTWMNTGATIVDCDMPQQQQEFLYYLCKAYDLDFTFVLALIDTESGFDPSIVSLTDDWGLMQINSCNHAWLSELLGVTDFLNPYDNMQAGCCILRALFERYEDTELVLMAYNLGESGAEMLWEKDIYSTCYTEKVLSRQQEFMAQIGGAE